MASHSFDAADEVMKKAGQLGRHRADRFKAVVKKLLETPPRPRRTETKVRKTKDSRKEP